MKLPKLSSTMVIVPDSGELKVAPEIVRLYVPSQLWVLVAAVAVEGADSHVAVQLALAPPFNEIDPVILVIDVPLKESVPV